MSLDENINWPKITDIIAAETRRSPGQGWRRQRNIWKNSRGEMFVPPSADRLKLRIIIAAHAGAAGHERVDATLKNIAGHFSWPDMKTDVKNLVQSCLYCLSSDSSHVVPRPLGHPLHATKPNEVIHFDYCYMGPSTGSEQYDLIVKDDLTSYVWLTLCEHTDALTTANCLLRWFPAFCTSTT